MTATTNTNKTKASVNYAFKIVGYLAHDNLLFDRACANGCKGFFSSREHQTCPKCGGALTWIISNGKPISISEGTIYPAMSDKQRARDLKEISKRKNGMPIRYRFKMFNFADDTGVLMPPPAHDKCVKGAKVEVMIMNHQVVPSWFLSKPDANGNKQVWVELMLPVYTNYGDSVKVLSDEEYITKVTPHDVLPNGQPAPIQVESNANDKKLAELDAKINQLQDLLQAALNGNIQSQQAAAAPSPVPQVEPEVEDGSLFDNAPIDDFDDTVDPF